MVIGINVSAMMNAILRDKACETGKRVLLNCIVGLLSLFTQRRS